MSNYSERININKKQNGDIRIVFGAHHYINITKEDNKLFCEIGCTHHGVKFESTSTNSELEKVIERLRVEFPENKTD